MEFSAHHLRWTTTTLAYSSNNCLASSRERLSWLSVKMNKTLVSNLSLLHRLSGSHPTRILICPQQLLYLKVAALFAALVKNSPPTRSPAPAPCPYPLLPVPAALV